MAPLKLTLAVSLLATSSMGLSSCAGSSTVAPPPASIPSPVLPPPTSVPFPTPTPTPVTQPTIPTTPAGGGGGSGLKITPTPDLRGMLTPTAEARDWQYIVIHHTATESGSVESIHEAHVKKKDKNGNPWLGIGYHFVIGNGQGMGDGEIQPTFRWVQQLHGAHAGSSDPAYNQRGVGICLVGNFEEHPPTTAQRHSARQLVDSLRAKYGISSERVVGHKEIRTTECPGRFFPMAEVAGSAPSLSDDRPIDKSNSLVAAGERGPRR